MTKKKQSNIQEFDRVEFLNEMKLRKVVQHIIGKVNKNNSRSRLTEDQRLRKIIRSLIVEAKTEVTPHASTAINFLEDLLKKILPGIEQDYKSLTTDPDQRKSFRAHFIKNIETGVDTALLNMKASAAVGGRGLIDITEAEDIDINVTDDPADDEKFIEIDPEEKEKQEEDPNEDTGSKLAARTYDRIDTQVIETFNILSDPRDQKLFDDYLITNLKLYFDKYEQELEGVIEPTTDEYEQEKTETETDEEEAEQAEEPEAAEDIDLDL